MKVCVIKPGARIAVGSSGTSGGTGEALSVIKILTTAGISVDVYAKVLKKDQVPTEFNIYNIENTYETINSKNYDALIIINGRVNYFGGIDNPADTLCYHVISHFNGPVFYILCDPNILLTQVWPLIEKKKWASSYKKEDILIARDDIVYISQPRNLELLKSIVDKKTNIKIKEFVHFPFEKFVYLTSDCRNYSFDYKYEYDLMYGGTFRSGRRKKDMIKFYFGYPDDIKVRMFGKIKEDDFKDVDLRYPEFGKAVSYDHFNDEMSKSLATVIISDPLYKELDDIAQRVYEGIITGNIVLIDESADCNKQVFGNNSTLSEFCYVRDRSDVVERIRMLKDRGADYIQEIVNLQRSVTNIDVHDYANELRNILECRI